MLDKITTEMVDDISATLRGTRQISLVEHQDRWVRLHFIPLLASTTRQILEAEYAVMDKYCNSPYLLACDCDTYAITLQCN